MLRYQNPRKGTETEILDCWNDNTISQRYVTKIPVRGLKLAFSGAWNSIFVKSYVTKIPGANRLLLEKGVCTIEGLKLIFLIPIFVPDSNVTLPKSLELN